MRMPIDWTIHVLDIETMGGILLTTVTFLLAYLYGKRKDRETANHQNYQRLELASIQVFQNEIEHPDLSDVWVKDRPTLGAGPLPLYFFDAFLYQQLNLFEMAYSFCADGQLDKEVLGSWLIWFANLCRSPYFREFWTQTEAPHNYVHGFQEIITKGCEIYSAETYATGPLTDAVKDKHRQFFAFVGKQMKSRELETWFDRTRPFSG